MSVCTGWADDNKTKCILRIVGNSVGPFCVGSVRLRVSFWRVLVVKLVNRRFTHYGIRRHEERDRVDSGVLLTQDLIPEDPNSVPNENELLLWREAAVKNGGLACWRSAPTCVLRTCRRKRPDEGRHFSGQTRLINVSNRGSRRRGSNRGETLMISTSIWRLCHMSSKLSRANA